MLTQAEVRATVGRHIFLLPALLAGFWLALAFEVRAADSPGEMVTDRPDFTNGPEVVSPGYLQIESGLLVESTHAGSARTRTFAGPSPLLRLGITRRFELRAGGDGVLLEKHSELGYAVRESGVSDVALGAKISLLEEGKRLPALSLTPSVSCPWGSRHFSSGGYDPGVALAWSHGLPAGFDADGNVIFLSTQTAGRRVLQRAYSLSVEHRLSPATQAYSEAYWIGPAEGAEGRWVFDGGLTRAIGANAQFDAAFGRSLSGAEIHWFATVGFSFRTRVWRPRHRPETP
jgi:hypothetical protein